MKKVTVLIFVLILCMTIFPFYSMAEDSEFCINFNIDGVDTERNGSGAVVYTDAFGASTATTSGYEIAVDKNGTVIEAGGNNNTSIPKGGFVFSVATAQKASVENVNIGDYAFYVAEAGTVTFVSENYSPFKTTVLEYTAINSARSENTLIIYRDREKTNTNTWGYEVCVDSEGTVVSLGGNDNIIPQGGLVLSAIGDKKQLLIEACELGMKVTLDVLQRNVTVVYGKENACELFALKIAECEDKLEKAYNALFEFDKASAEKLLDLIKSLSDSAIKASENDNIPEFAAYRYAFEKAVSDYYYTLIPYLPVEQRSIWLRIPTASTNSTIEKTVKAIADYGFNSVCIEGLFDNTTIFPVPEGSPLMQNPSFKGKDMLKLYIDEFHKYGIEVTLWMSCYRSGYLGSSNSAFSVAAKIPEWRNINQNGDDFVSNEYGNAYFLNPSLPEVKEFLLDTYRYLLETYEFDGFQLDYIRYPENSNGNYGYDDYTISLFKEKYGYSEAPLSSSDVGWNEWCELRCSFVTDLVSSVSEMIKQIRPDVYFSVDVAPDYSSTYSKMCQDTSFWITEGLVDIVYPMAYGTTDAVMKWTGITTELCKNKNVLAVIGLRDNGAEIYTEQVSVIRNSEALGTAFFSYSQYIDNDYIGNVEEKLFSDPAVSPTLNGKNALIAQLKYFTKILSSSDAEYPETEKMIISASELSDLLEKTSVTQCKEEIDNFVINALSLYEKMISEEDVNFAEFVYQTYSTVKLISVNCKDDEKTLYATKIAEEDNAEAEESSEDVTQISMNAFEKVFQILFIVIMTTGILGLPLYFYLSARKKRIAKQCANDNSGDDPDDKDN